MRALLKESGATYNERTIDGGHQFRVGDGSIICAYTQGAVAFQGKETPLAFELASKLSTEGAQVASTGVGAKLDGEVILPAAGLDEANRLTQSAAVATRDENESLRFPVAVPLSGNLSKAVQNTFLEYTQKFADDLASEVERLEEGARAGRTTPPEFTSHMIHDAYRVVRKDRSLQARPTKLSYATDVVYAVSGPCFGAMTSYFHSAWQGAVFAVLFLAWLVTLTVKIARRGGQEL